MLRRFADAAREVALSETTTYGLTPTGFVRMRLPEIQTAILAAFKAKTGADLDPSPDSLTGQLVATFAEREAALWELAEQTYLSAYPATAEDVSLDLAVSYSGVTRLNAGDEATRENDDVLRARYRFGVYRLGAGTLPAIEANLRQDVPGVETVRVYENITDAIDADGRAPHSVEAVVEGGTDAAVATRLWRIKPAGIVTAGNTLVSVLDSAGFPQLVRFSRPEPRYIWLKAALTPYGEEVLPGNVGVRAAEAMAAAGNALGAGQDLLLQRIAASVFGATSGVARVTLTAAVTTVTTPAPAAGAYTANDIVIGPRERAKFDVARILVT